MACGNCKKNTARTEQTRVVEQKPNIVIVNRKIAPKINKKIKLYM